MSDASVRVIDGRAVVRVGGSELLAPITAGAKQSAADAADSADASAQSAAAAALAESGAVAAAGTLFPTTAAGLAATAANGFFTVVGDGASTYAILYKKVGSEAVEQARYASKAAYEGPAGAAMIGTSDALGGPSAPAIHSYEQVRRLTHYGFKGNGSALDTEAWRDAIADARETKLRKLVVPRGISVVDGSIVDESNPLPQGLTFIGEGFGANSRADGSPNKLQYTGSGVCWNVAYPTGGPGQIGGWTFQDMAFQCTDPAGGMFSLGDPLTHTPDDDPAVDPYMFLLGVEFLSCFAYGSSGTGDFFQACKTFEVKVDSRCEVYNFRRAFWGKGCDNWRIEARMVGNNRDVMLEKVGAFGNNNWVDLHTTSGPGQSFGGEPSYSIYDTSDKLSIGKGTMFEGDARAANMYLDGYGTLVMSPMFGNLRPMWEHGPRGREIVVFAPRTTTVDARRTPIIRPPANPNIGSVGYDYRMRIIDAPLSIQAVLPIHPRIVQMNTLRNPTNNAPDPFQPMMVSAAGPMAISHICTAYNYWGTPGAPGGGGIKEMYSDAALDGGWVMRLTKGTAVPANIPAEGPIEQGFALNFVMGVDIWPGQYQIVNRMRLGSGTSNAGWAFAVLVNGVFHAALTLPISTAYATIADTIDLTKTVGDAPIPLGAKVSINVYNGSSGATGVDLLVQAIKLEPIRDVGWTAGTGAASKGAFTAYPGQALSGAYVQATEQTQDDAIRDASQRLLAIERALRAQAIIN
jgi:hypothetical protein